MAFFVQRLDYYIQSSVKALLCNITALRLIQLRFHLSNELALKDFKHILVNQLPVIISLSILYYNQHRSDALQKCQNIQSKDVACQQSDLHLMMTLTNRTISEMFLHLFR